MVFGNRRLFKNSVRTRRILALAQSASVPSRRLWHRILGQGAGLRSQVPGRRSMVATWLQGADLRSQVPGRRSMVATWVQGAGCMSQISGPRSKIQLGWQHLPPFWISRHPRIHHLETTWSEVRHLGIHVVGSPPSWNPPSNVTCWTKIQLQGTGCRVQVAGPRSKIYGRGLVTFDW